MRKYEVKLSHPLQAGKAEPLAEVLREPRGEAGHQVLAVVRALLTELLDLDDLAPDEPVRMDHRRVDGPRDPLDEPAQRPRQEEARLSSAPGPPSPGSSIPPRRRCPSTAGGWA